MLLVASSCVVWREPPADFPQPIPERWQVRVWSGGSRAVVHGVQLSADSLSGVPRWQLPQCDSCRVSWSLASVDSMQVGQPSTARTVALVGGIYALALSLYAAAYVASGS